MAVDPRPARETDARDGRLVIRRPPFARVGHVQKNDPSDAPDRQFARELVIIGSDALQAGALERDLRKVGGVDEVGAPQVLVALRLSGPETRRVDRRLHGQRFGVVGVELQVPVNILEVSPHPSHHHVSDAELGGGMSGLEGPLGHDDPLSPDHVRGTSVFYRFGLRLAPINLHHVDRA